jgi:hypothetical protein
MPMIAIFKGDLFLFSDMVGEVIGFFLVEQCFGGFMEKGRFDNNTVVFLCNCTTLWPELQSSLDTYDGIFIATKH